MAMPKFGIPGVSTIHAAPAAKENNGSCDCNSHGLLAYGAGSSVVIVDVRSMQLITVLPMPSPGSTAFTPAPFVTAVKWTPEGLQRDLTDECATAHLRLAVGDKQGRVGIWNVGTGEVSTWLTLEGDKGKQGIQDICWVYGQPWLLISIHGASLVSLWDTNSGRSIWKIDASPESLACIKRDPFDSRQICIIGSKGLVLSVYIGGMTELDISVKRYQLNVLEDRMNNQTTSAVKGVVMGDRDSGKDAMSLSGSSTSSNLGLISGNNIRCLFSTTNRGILFIMFPRELFVFDLQFGTVLSNNSLPRGSSKLMDLIATVDGNFLYCAHVDGKFTAWARKENQQAYSLCFLDALLPQLGTTVPAPSVLCVVNCSYQLLVENLENCESQKECPTVRITAPVAGNSNPLSTKQSDSDKSSLVTTILSISDDGRLWHWSVVFGGSNSQTWEMKPSIINDDATSFPRTDEVTDNGEAKSREVAVGKLESSNTTPKFKLILQGQLNLLPSPISTFAVPVPSLLATIPGGGNGPAVSVPLIALATHAGTIELVDAMSNAITSSFLVHTSSIRGLRWLGNSRLVSFSYTEVKGKGGGFINNLAVTCVRSGQSKPFRVLQKPERAPVRFLRTSPSGRYLLILFREAPAEVWAMTKNPQMLRSLALPFTVMEWALPPAPKSNASSQSSSSRSSLFYKERPTIASTVAAANADPGPGPNAEVSQDELAESFAFALVNGSLGVFELRGRRVRDFRPKWPSAAFVSADVLVTAMAYRTPHVVMGDRSGNIRWWDVTSGMSSTFNTHRGGIRRIRFAPVVAGDQTRGRVSVLFNDYTFAIYDLNAPDPLKSAIYQSHLVGILVSEIDWFPLRVEDIDSMLLCIAGADSTFRLLEVNTSSVSKSLRGSQVKSNLLEHYRPMPLCSPALLPLPHALALRMLLQLGVQPSWFTDHLKENSKTSQNLESADLRSYMLETALPGLGEVVVAELLLKALEPYRRAGRLLDLQGASTYATLASKSSSLRFAFAAAHFGDYDEALFWLQLPHALNLLGKEILAPNHETESLRAPKENTDSANKVHTQDTHIQSSAPFSRLNTQNESSKTNMPTISGLEIVPNDQKQVLKAAQERINWHAKLHGSDAVQKRVHELISLGDNEAAVTLLLSTPPDSPHFYVDALRAISLASAVSPALHQLAVKVIAANLVATENSLSGTHLLCAVGCYQEACTQLQDTGRWSDAATLAAAHLQGTDYSRVLQRWADHVLYIEKNLWRAMILYVSAGSLANALAALRDAKLPDTAAMFLLACHESNMSKSETESCNGEKIGADWLNLPGDLNTQKEEIQAVCEYYGQYQIALAHLCTGVPPVLY